MKTLGTLKTAIYKTRNAGMGNGMRGIRGTPEMFTMVPRNLLKDFGECSVFSIPQYSPKDSRECSRRFWEMFKKILGNVQEDSAESKHRFIS